MRTIIIALLHIAISCSLYAQKENLLSSKYSAAELQQILIPQSEWKPFPLPDDREGWSKADKDMLQAATEEDEGVQRNTQKRRVMLFFRSGKRQDDRPFQMICNL
jgi:hypothetical protein